MSGSGPPEIASSGPAAAPRYVVVGAGRQGRAAAMDLALHGGAGSVLIADADDAAARAAASAVDAVAGGRVARSASGDAADPAALAAWLEGADACLCALPYRHSPAVAGACLSAACHHADLGGDPVTVAEVLAMDPEAKEAGVSLVPDCGLAPGLANVATVRAVELARARAGSDPAGGWTVRVRCGGLPVEPCGPLDYALVFSPWGLLKEYQGTAVVVREGQVRREPALSGLEEVVFAGPPGRCEAFLTVGGASSLPATLAGRLARYDYKTVRYPGHRDRVRLLSDLGLMDEAPIAPAGGGPAVAPRALLCALLEERLPRDVPDLVVLRIEVEGPGLDGPVRLEVREFGSPDRGLSAMERCTGFPAAAIVHAQATGEVAPGARPPERAVPAAAYLEAVAARGIRVEEAPASGQGPMGTA